MRTVRTVMAAIGLILVIIVLVYSGVSIIQLIPTSPWPLFVAVLVVLFIFGAVAVTVRYIQSEGNS